MHGLARETPYMLVASQDVGFLWDQRVNDEPGTWPTAAFSMMPVVERYLPELESGKRLRGALLDFAIVQWLNDLAAGDQPVESEPEVTLAGSGFLSVIWGAVVHVDEWV